MTYHDFAVLVSTYPLYPPYPLCDIIQNMKHPAVRFGEWLKAHRRKTGVVMRVFANQVSLSPAQYAEVELGITHWVGKEQEKLIAETLKLPTEDKKRLKEMLAKARSKEDLTLGDIYTREQLEPVRARSENGKPTSKSNEAILDAVFTPLS